MGGRTGILKVLRDTGSWRGCAGSPWYPGYPGRPSPLILPASPSYSRCLIPTRGSRDTHPRHPTSPYRPFWRHYLCHLLHIPARTRSPWARSAVPLPALPPPGCSYSGVSRRAALSLQVLPARIPLSSGRGRRAPSGGARRRRGSGALRSVQLLDGTLCAAVGQWWSGGELAARPRSEPG